MRLIFTALGHGARAVAICALSLPHFFTPAAMAADIYDRGPRAGSAYDDPRYADIYGDTQVRRYEQPRHAEPHYNPPRYAERHDPLPPRVYRDEYLAPMPGVRRFRDHRAGLERGGCIDRRDARDQLIADGWRDFRDLELREEVALITARRGGGQTYRLKLDRCTGEILDARAIDGDQDRYAERRRNRYYD